MNAVPFYSGFTSQDFLFMVQGAGRTMLLTVLAGLLGTIVGALLGWIRAHRIPAIHQVLGAYIDIIRTVPLIIQIIVVNSGASLLGAPVTPFSTGLLVLSTYMSAFTSEIVMAGILSVPQPLRRAARGLGMTKLQELRYVVIPLGVRTIFPSWIGLLLGLMKDTSLVAVVGYIELLRASQIIITRTNQPLEILFLAGLFYFVMSYAVSRWAAYAERRWAGQ